MAKNITIAEGGSARNFTAKKLKTNLTGGGDCTWVPEDEVLDYVELKDKEFTANGEYEPSDFNADGFGKITINVASGVKEKVITQNGTFYARDDNVMGYDKVTVNVPTGGGGGPFTVIFFNDEGQEIQKDTNVPYDGSSSCILLDGTVVNGQYFKGWNPSPTKVRSNMNCYPVRGEYIIDPTEIMDSWETICAAKGAGYPLGSYKALSLYGIEIPGTTIIDAYTGNEIVVPSRTCAFAQHMIKVAEGEDNSTSTWLSSAGFIVTDGNNNIDGFNHPWNVRYTDNWGNSRLKQWFDKAVITIFPECIRNSIVEVDKVSQVYNGDYMDLTTPSRLWIPSAKEMEDLFNLTIGTSDVYGPATRRIESLGVNYNTVYVPSLGNNNGYATRTVCCATTSYTANSVGMFNKTNDNYYWNGTTCPLFMTNPYYSYQIGFCL